MNNLSENMRERERERERNSNNTIDLKTLDNEIAKIAGRATQTRIDMQSLWNEVQNLKATTKQWEIVTCNKSGKGYVFDSKYLDWNFVVIGGFMGATGDGYITWQNNNGGIYVRAVNLTSDNYYFTWSKSGNLIVPNLKSEMKNSITVLFYK